MKSVLLDTDDLCVAEETVSAFFGKIHMDASRDDVPTHARMMRSLVGSTSIDEADFGYSFTYSMAPPDRIMLARIHSGAMELETEHGHAHVFGPGTVGAIGSLDDEPFNGTVHQGHWDTFLIDSVFFEQIASSRDDGPIRLTGSIPVSDAANRQLVAAMDYVRDVIAANPQAAQNPLLAGTAQRHLAAAILTAYPNTNQSADDTADSRDATQGLLRRAVAFIEENAHRDISLRDIADAVHVTPRAVQYMFRKHRDRTPMQYLRELRLHYAHLDLIAGDPSMVSVRSVALRWGFAHTGRFAASYRAVYGRSPHATLRA